MFPCTAWHYQDITSQTWLKWADAHCIHSINMQDSVWFLFKTIFIKYNDVYLICCGDPLTRTYMCQNCCKIKDNSGIRRKCNGKRGKQQKRRDWRRHRTIRLTSDTWRSYSCPFLKRIAVPSLIAHQDRVFRARIVAGQAFRHHAGVNKAPGLNTWRDI